MSKVKKYQNVLSDLNWDVGSILSEGCSVVWILITVKLTVSLLTRHFYSLNKLNVKGKELEPRI